MMAQYLWSSLHSYSSPMWSFCTPWRILVRKESTKLFPSVASTLLWCFSCLCPVFFCMWDHLVLYLLINLWLCFIPQSPLCWTLYSILQEMEKCKTPWKSSGSEKEIEAPGKSITYFRWRIAFPRKVICDYLTVVNRTQISYNARNLRLIPGLGRFAGEGNGNPLQYSCLENPINRGAWRDTVHEVAESWT